MQRLLREPVVHFAVLGALIFAAHGLVAGQPPDEAEVIHMDRGDIAAIQKMFEQTWRRPPTRSELKNRLDERVREEVYYREALRLGLDQGDTIIRRRLQQKLEFLIHDLAVAQAPSEATLRGYHDAHRDQFRTDPTFSFEQVYFREGADPDKAAARAQALRDALNAGQTLPTDAGDVIAFERSYTDIERTQVAATFGDGFADAIEAVEPGAWHAPIRSGYGVHAVRVTAHTPGRVPDYAEIADAVKREWERSEREAANQRVEQELMGRYEIRIDLPGEMPSP